MSVCRFVAVLALAVTLSGCPAAKIYKEGAVYQEAGREYEAANRYLDALGVNDGHKKSREALLMVAEPGYKENLQLAEGYETRQNFAEALRQYQELGIYLQRLRDADAAGFQTVDVASKVDEMQNSAAEERYQAAEKLLVAQSYAAAIAAYRQAQEFKAVYKDTNEKIATCFYGIGEAEFAAKRYRSSAEGFADAVKVGGPSFNDAANRGGELYLALGAHFLEADKCRRAVRDLRTAQALLGVGSVAKELAAAEECAVTPVAVMPFENRTGINPAGLSLGDAVADKVLAEVRGKASEFVRIVDRTALDTLLAEQGLTGGAPAKLRGVRYLVTGRLTQVLVEEPKLVSTAKTTAGRERYACTKTNKEGQSYQAECVRDVVINYVDYTAKSTIKLVASAKVIDAKTGEQVGAPQLTALAESAVHYADNFFVGGIATAPVPYNRTGGTETMDDNIMALAKAPRDVQPTTVLVDQAVGKLGTDLAAEIVRQVDQEPTVSDPPTLTLRTSR